jgi:hypothetical protein
MLAPADLVKIPCTPDLISSGITCACRALSHPGATAGRDAAQRLRSIVAQAATALAFRHHLDEQGIPFVIPRGFTAQVPEDIPLLLGGHRCLLQTSLVSRARQVDQMTHSSGVLLQAPALLPMEGLEDARNKADDILLYAFLLGRVPASRTEMDQARKAGTPLRLIHPMPTAWARPSAWIPLNDLSMKSECEQPISVDLLGVTASRDHFIRRLELPPRQRVAIPEELCAVTCLLVERLPEARLGIHSPVRGEACLILPFDWSNLWIECATIVLAGWLTRQNYLRRAEVLKGDQRTFPLDRPAGKSLAVPLKDLNPVAPLLRRVKTWAQGK